jgi:zinc protease
MPVIPIQKTVLNNGLTVVVSPKSDAPVVTVDVMYRVGSHDEVRGKSGLAHLFEHLMFDNTSTGMSKQYDTYCTKAGGSNNAYTTHDFTNYFINLPSHQLELGLWLESERMREFNIKQEHLSTQISVVLEEMKQNVENQPYAKWRFAMAEESFADDCSYSWDVYGKQEDVAGVQLADAEKFFRRFYNPSNSVLCIAGDIEVERAFQLAEKYYGDITGAAEKHSRTELHNRMLLYGKHRVVEDSVPIPATFIGMHVPTMLSDDIYPAELAAMALGSGRNSPLYQHMIKNTRLASAAGAFLDKRAQSSQLIFYSYAALPSAQSDDLIREIKNAVSNYVYTQADHQKAVNKIKASIASEFQRASGIADSVAFHQLFYDDGGMVNTVLENYDSCSIDAVQSCIASFANLENGVRVDVVPA